MELFSSKAFNVIALVIVVMGIVLAVRRFYDYEYTPKQRTIGAFNFVGFALCMVVSFMNGGLIKDYVGVALWIICFISEIRNEKAKGKTADLYLKNSRRIDKLIHDDPYVKSLLSNEINKMTGGYRPNVAEMNEAIRRTLKKIDKTAKSD